MNRIGHAPHTHAEHLYQDAYYLQAGTQQHDSIWDTRTHRQEHSSQRSAVYSTWKKQRRQADGQRNKEQNRTQTHTSATPTKPLDDDGPSIKDKKDNGSSPIRFAMVPFLGTHSLLQYLLFLLLFLFLDDDNDCNASGCTGRCRSVETPRHHRTATRQKVDGINRTVLVTVR